MKTYQIAEIRARLEAASPSPWEATANGLVLGQPRPEHAGERHVADTVLNPDAELIANAPNDMAFLLSLVEQLQGQLDAAHQTIDSLVTDVRWLLGEFGDDHWRNCDLGDDGCYLCGGYETVGKRWEHAGVPGEQ